MKLNINYLFILFFLLFSCKTKQKPNELNYLQNIELTANDAVIKNSKATIQKGDQLIILVSAKDMDVVKPFNQNYSSSELVQSAIPPSGNTPSSGNISLNGPTYIVDMEGNIDFPVIGKLNTTNKTITDFKNELREEMTKYVINPTVNIRLANFKITVLGEVVRPGDYTIINGQTTLLNALGLAGDFTIYAKRDDILVLRNENGIISRERINILNDRFLDSPYYNLKQGDVILVNSNENKSKLAKQNPNTSIYIGIASIALTAIAIAVSVLKK